MRTFVSRLFGRLSHVALLVVLVFGTLLQPGNATPVYADDPAVGDNSVGINTQVNTWARNGGGTEAGGGSFRLQPGCYYSGSYTWGDPRNNDATGSIRTNSVAQLGLADNPRFVRAWEERIAAAKTSYGFISNSFNLDSMYWKNSYADLLAAALQIERSGSSWKLVLRPASERLSRFYGTTGYYYNPSPGMFSTQTLGRGTPIEETTLWTTAPESISSWVWPLGLGPRMSQTGNKMPTQTQAYERILGRLGSLGGYATFGPQQMAHHFLPNTFSLFGSQEWQLYYLQTALARSYVRETPYGGWPIDIYANVNPMNGEYTGRTYYRWTQSAANYWNSQGGMPENANWTALLWYPNRNSVYSRDEVLAGFKAVVRDQLDTQWNESPSYSDRIIGRNAPGSYFHPIMADGEAGGRCAPDTVAVNGVILGKTGSDCRPLAATSNSNYAAALNGGCSLFWNYRREEPPKLTAQQFNSAVSRIFTPIQFAPAVGTAVVNQPVRFSAVASSVRSRGFSFPIDMPAPFPDHAANLTQVGVVARIGEEVIKFIPRSSATGSEYSFDYAFPQTPAAKMQEPECLAARTRDRLEAICGIVFRTNAAGAEEPVYVMTIETLWDGQYQLPPEYPSRNRALFSPQHSTISNSARARITSLDHPIWDRDPSDRWIDSWGFSRASYNGNVNIGWPNFGDTSPDDYGSPMYSAICNSAALGGQPNMRCVNGFFQVVIPVIQIQPTTGG